MVTHVSGARRAESQTSVPDPGGPAIAIVGSGPAGCYLAQHLLKLLPAARITIFERLPVPYGLIRYGVAPDHQGTKSVTRQFDRLFELGQIEFSGNIDVGIDVSLDRLRASFDVVALAAGIHTDRKLHIPGEDLPGVYRAGKMLRMVNGHPDEPGEVYRFGRQAVIIGNGNVAVDVLRLLIKSEDDFDASDIDGETLARLGTRDLTEVHIVGRSSALAAKYSPANIRELSKINGVRFQIAGHPAADVAGDEAGLARLAALSEIVANEVVAPIRSTVTFHFGWSPLAIDGSERVQRIAFNASDGSGKLFALDADSIVTAVGFAKRPHGDGTSSPMHLLEGDTAAGRIDGDLYCTGWYRRGAQGTIPENRLDARQVAEMIALSLAGCDQESRKPGMSGLPAEIVEKAVSFAGWQAIDAAETGTASPGRVRQKIRSWNKLLETAYDRRIEKKAAR